MLGELNVQCGGVETEALIRSEGLSEGLRRKKLRLESQLRDANEALDALQNNPELLRVLELVMKTARF